MSRLATQKLVMPLVGATLLATHSAYSHYDETRKNGFNDIKDIIQSSVYFNPVTILSNTILDYFATKSSEGWDGYDAKAITQSSKEMALKLVKKLPQGIQRPEVIPSAAGGYSFEWFALKKILTIEIENQEISWSFIDADHKRKQSGYEQFNGSFPTFVDLLLIQEFPMT